MSSSSSSSSTSFLAKIGFGYSIVIALASLVLLSTAILTSYFCCNRNRYDRNHNRRRINHPSNPQDGIILPRIIFVADDDDQHDSPPAVGLDQNVINSYPRFEFSRESNGGGGVGQNTTCSICLCEYRDSEMLRMMPECRHYFHLCCLDAWLRLNGSCPVCRNSPLPTPLPTPLSTPLQEVVPLSQYAADRRRS